MVYAYDEAGHLIGEYDGVTGAAEQETVWLGDLPVAVLTGDLTSPVVYNVHPDHLSAPKVITDQIGNVVWNWDHDPFGNGQPTGTLSYNLRFPGQYYDVETGLNYNMNRDYDPVLGRYVQSDPIGLEGGINTYGYVGQNPISNADPEGTFAVPVAEAALVGGAALLGVTVMSQNNALQKLASNAVDSVQRQIEYVRAKNFCDTPPEPGSNDCSTLSRQIDHAEQCVSLYSSWDSKWDPGRHSQKLQDWMNRVNNLKEKRRRECTSKCQ